MEANGSKLKVCRLDLLAMSAIRNASEATTIASRMGSCTTPGKATTPGLIASLAARSTSGQIGPNRAIVHKGGLHRPAHS